MGIVTDHITQVIQRQIDERGIVVWFDPDRVYEPLLPILSLSDAKILQYTGSFLRLRRDADQYLNNMLQDVPPRLLLYIPITRSQANHILDEFIFGGTVLQPGEPLPRNTSLDVIARQSLRMVFSREKLDDICTEIENGRISSLDELDRLAEQGSANSVSLIFNTNNPNEIAFQFLTTDSNDEALTEKSAVPTLVEMFTENFGGNLQSNDSPAQVRVKLQRHLLITDFCLIITGNIPESLANFGVPQRASQREACLSLVQTWRHRTDTQQNYAQTAVRVQNEMGISKLSMDEITLQNVYTFTATEEQLQRALVESLLIRPTQEMVELAQVRRASFWGMIDESLSTSWALISFAGQLILKSSAIQRWLKNNSVMSAEDFVYQYTQRDGWWHLDALHRALERYYIALDFAADDRHSALERLMAKARHDYAFVVDLLAQQFIPLLAKSRFKLENQIQQRDVFSQHVAPLIGKKKIAYVLVDALRFEMAYDLFLGLGDEWKATVRPVIGTPPTVTPVGMAALMPGAESGMRLVDSAGIAVEVKGRLLKDRKDRVALLSDTINDFCEIKLESLLPAKKSTRDAISKAKFILVTSQEIDLLGEGDSVIQAREFMDSTLPKLVRAFRSLADLGVEYIVISADHGYLFSDELDIGSTIPAPGGETIKLERRVWIGRGGDAITGVFRASAASLGVDGNFELATPLGLACFSASGGKSYFHGGLSLQELVIPLLTLQPVKQVLFAPVEWEFIPSREKITTRFFSVQIQGKIVGLFDAYPVVRVEIKVGAHVVSTTVSATYGLSEATGEIKLKSQDTDSRQIEPNTVAVMLTSDVIHKKAIVQLIDAETERILKQFEISVDIAI